MKTLRCDRCERVEAESSARFSWLTLEDAMGAPQLSEPGVWHLCSWVCLRDFAKERIGG